MGGGSLAVKIGFMVGIWWVVSCGWELVNAGLWLMADGWKLVVVVLVGWLMIAGGWWVVGCGWQLVGGG